jgi:PCFT/HCP family folate transporter-like MFS transporter 1/3
MKVKDTVLALIGLGAYFGQNMIRALMLTETGFYISIFVGGLGSVASVGIRSHFSKIVEHKELGKVFSLMSAIDAVVPLIASSIFTTVFRATMDTMPGLSFIITGGLLLIPFMIMMWIDIYTIIPNFDNKKPDNQEKKEEKKEEINEVFSVEFPD